MDQPSNGMKVEIDRGARQMNVERFPVVKGFGVEDDVNNPGDENVSTGVKSDRGTCVGLKDFPC